MNIFLPLFEKIILHLNKQKIFDKILMLIKELIINNFEKLINANKDNFLSC